MLHHSLPADQVCAQFRNTEEPAFWFRYIVRICFMCMIFIFITLSLLSVALSLHWPLGVKPCSHAFLMTF